jgi:hypothetical protein
MKPDFYLQFNGYTSDNKNRRNETVHPNGEGIRRVFTQACG